VGLEWEISPLIPNPIRLAIHSRQTAILSMETHKVIHLEETPAMIHLGEINKAIRLALINRVIRLARNNLEDSKIDLMIPLEIYYS